ncbi:MAG TPA: ABC transporter permease [Peptococcaceae bacterium]|nr:ABC transporter permease [Peptococcaceae bacterium]HPZ70701.1 ABC transporter permease [Peptococcaceae bacterium]HQD54065.1 ABC transporter permease [Peptococcaceae bacterium]
MLRIVKKAEMTKTKQIGIRILAVILALLTAALLIFAMDLNPLAVYGGMLKGAFGSAYRIREVVIEATSLTIASLGIAIAFRMQFWNIGGEGQILMGAFAATYFALHFPDLPAFFLLSTMIIAAMIGGGLWAMIPAFFKAQWKTNETIITLMMNYIALKWVMYLQFGPWKDPTALGFPKIPNFTANAILPKVFGVHIGWIFALILVFLVAVFLNHSKKGYEIAVLGESEQTALYAGINVKRTIITAVFWSGALCGLVGMIQASALNNTLSIEVSEGIGFTAIITTWLAALKPVVILLVSVLFAALVQGASYIQTAFGIPQAAAELLQGMILFFVLGSEFFIRYRFVLDRAPLGGLEEEMNK